MYDVFAFRAVTRSSTVGPTTTSPIRDSPVPSRFQRHGFLRSPFVVMNPITIPPSFPPGSVSAAFAGWPTHAAGTSATTDRLEASSGLMRYRPAVRTPSERVTGATATGVLVGVTDGLIVGLADGAGPPTPVERPGSRL